jgi:NAD-dependent deacetylase
LVVPDQNIAKLIDMIHSARYCAAFTGAGVSVPSGLPCFREPRDRTSIPEKTAAELEAMIRGFFGPSADPSWEELFSIESFERDPALFYEKSGPLIYHDKKPSVVHRVLAQMERSGLLKAVITQNIDRLHRAAGSRRVIELHGSPDIHYCLRCPGIRVSYEEAAGEVRQSTMPLCPVCGRPLKPAITLYGEPLPLEARRLAETEAQAADLLLILGTSLKVFPAADIPRATLRRGGRIVIVNRDDTILDDDAALRFRDLEETFTTLAALLPSMEA